MLTYKVTIMRMDDNVNYSYTNHMNASTNLASPTGNYIAQLDSGANVHTFK